MFLTAIITLTICDTQLVYSIVTNITACLLIERNTGNSTIYDYDRSAAAIDMAVDYTNNILLPENYVLRTVYEDIGNTCSEKSSIIGHAMRLQEQGIACDVYIGPGCGFAAEVLYDYASYYDIPLIGCPAAELGASASIADYDMMTRVSITYTTVADVLVRFFHHHNYTTPVFLQDFSLDVFNVMNKVIKGRIKEQHWILYYNTIFVRFHGNSLTKQDIRQCLLDAHKTSRVILLLANAKTVRKFMIQAHSLGMTTGDHVFLAVELFPSTIWGDYTWKLDDEDNEVAKKAFLTLLLLSLHGSTSSSVDQFWQDVITTTSSKYNFTRSGLQNQEVDPIVTHFYDSVILVGNVFSELILNGSDFSSARLWGAFTANYTFVSPVNGIVVLNNDSDRLWYYVIRNFDQETSKYEECLGFPPTGKMEILGIFDDWPNYKFHLPPNTPRCGFLNENPACHPLKPTTLSPEVMVGIIVPVFFILSGTSAGFVALKRFRNVQHREAFAWRINHSQLADLDKPMKDMVVQSSSIRKSSHSFECLANEIDASSLKLRFRTTVRTAVFAGATVEIQQLPAPHFRVSYTIHREACLLQRIQHQNLQKFIGIVVDDDNRCEYVLSEFCSKGCLCLDDLLSDMTFELDWEFRRSLIKDLCTVFVPISVLESPNVTLPETAFENFLWRAPELLRCNMPAEGTQKGDVYSFGILLQQIALRSKPFKLAAHVPDREITKASISAKDIVLEVKQGSFPLLRPPTPSAAFLHSGFLYLQMESCWNEDPLLRPTMGKVKALFSAHPLFDRAGDNLVDHLIRKLEKYAIGLERQIDEKTTQFMEEKERSEQLLTNILPKSIASSLMQGRIVNPESFDQVTIYFGDIPHFGDLVIQAASTAAEYLQILENLYITYDSVIEDYDAYKVESLNDACLEGRFPVSAVYEDALSFKAASAAHIFRSQYIVSGLPNRNGDRHVEVIADIALMLKQGVEKFKIPSSPQTRFRLRVGIHSGPCVAGVVGAKLPKYCIFGDTVNTASRMETTGEAGRIQCSEVTKSLLWPKPAYSLEARGTVTVKGKGLMETFWLQKSGPSKPETSNQTV